MCVTVKTKIQHLGLKEGMIKRNNKVLNHMSLFFVCLRQSVKKGWCAGRHLFPAPNV